MTLIQCLEVQDWLNTDILNNNILGATGKHLLLIIIKQVHHCLLNCGVYELVGIRIIGNNDSILGSIQDVKFAMSNNILSKVYVGNPVGELELV